MRVQSLLLAGAFALAGCSQRGPEPDPLGYTIAVPDDVPGEMELIAKDGTRHMGNGRELYAAGHKYGWRLCRTEFERGRLDPQDVWAYENFTPCECGVSVRGFVDGFRACQRTLLGSSPDAEPGTAADGAAR